jgi:hypothetical protein
MHKDVLQALGSVQIHLFGTDAVVADADDIMDLFQEGRLFLFHIKSFRLLLLITVVQANGQCKYFFRVTWK